MADLIATLQHPVREGEKFDLINENNLPPSKQLFKPRIDFDQSAEGKAARKVLTQLKFNYDRQGVARAAVFTVGPPGENRSWYIPTDEHYHPTKPGYDTYYAHMRFSRDRATEAAEKQAADEARRTQEEERRAAQREADDRQRQQDMDDRRKDAERKREEARLKLEEARQRVEDAKLEAEIRKMEAEAAAAAAAAGAGTTPGTTPGTGPTNPYQPGISMRTWEVIGRIGGRIVPLTSAIQRGPMGWQIVPGATVSVGDAPTDGSGVAGVPGRWAEHTMLGPPEAYGLDPGRGVLAMGQGPQGVKPYPVPATLLQDIWGPGWRATVYGA